MKKLLVLLLVAGGIVGCQTRPASVKRSIQFVLQFEPSSEHLSGRETRKLDDLASFRGNNCLRDVRGSTLVLIEAVVPNPSHSAAAIELANARGKEVRHAVLNLALKDAVVLDGTVSEAAPQQRGSAGGADAVVVSLVCDPAN